ncbi:DUF2274 domain-containing protein [Blastomonas marina]|uniref:DUF2274 domain-containing protein n=1 Tax=Blastomonas marina TaxID=1867408 RepID=UPI002AC90FAD|nr:DUF2274 domain-containing protein [Blastomonas marina]WPZ03272.1 DUF2274 domain-containing protein [Blastomonas marina]
MTRLKLSDITDGKPVKLTIEIPARLHRRLIEYGTVLNGGVHEDAPVPEVLIPPMIERFVASDRDFAKARRRTHASSSR